MRRPVDVAPAGPVRLPESGLGRGWEPALVLGVTMLLMAFGLVLGTVILFFALGLRRGLVDFLWDAVRARRVRADA